ncbi:hypothetical protein [Absidia glauca]|uniref:Uncharacterized protein n=1 Tax=Absidia glauca TaxID=4829 RepID=A0A168NJU2_ABSGL|nr:hypothetical protein [Absidia glauca]
MVPTTSSQDDYNSQIYLLKQELQDRKDELAQEQQRQVQIYRRVKEAGLPFSTNDADDYQKIQQRMEQVIDRGRKIQKVLALQVKDREAKLEHVMGDDDTGNLEALEAELKDDLARYDKELEELKQQQQQQSPS